MEDFVEPIEISGVVESVVFQNDDNGYAIVRVKDSDDIMFTLTGCLPFVFPGEALVAQGSWTEHPTYGKQFKCEYAKRMLPSVPDDIYKYLSSGVIKGVGPSLAALIVDKFQDKTLGIIANHPEKLETIKGISHNKANSISELYSKQNSLRTIIEYVCSYGLRPLIGLRLYRVYADKAVEAVKQNPYIIVNEAIGGTFSEADSVALETGVELLGDYRINAALIYELKYNSNFGHCFIPIEKLVAATAQLIDVEQDRINPVLESMLSEGSIILEEIAGVRACYLPSLYDSETGTAEMLASRAGRNSSTVFDTGKIISMIEEKLQIQYTDLQKEAIQDAAAEDVLLITGGPGTGKTTIINGILSLFDMLGLSTLLCAPTGRAAKRITAVTQREALTIHRLLEARMDDDMQTVSFNRNSENPIVCDVLIIDESSMIDINLMHAILQALPEKAKLLLVGDADQLPSVGPGNVFSAIVRSECVPVIRLTQIFRQKQNSLIVKNAHMINRGERPDLNIKDGDFFRLNRTDNDAAAETIVDLVSRRLPVKLGMTPENIQILTPSRRGAIGTRSLNLLMQKAVNPPSPDKSEKHFGEIVFRTGDKVMQIKNNYDILWVNSVTNESGLGIFNGDIGKIVRIDISMGTITVDYDGRMALYPFENIDELEHAWAITVHKSQGSEFDAVVFALSDISRMLLTREIIYTGITRARKMLVLVGNQDVFYRMIDNDKGSRRYSALRVRLKQLCGLK